MENLAEFNLFTTKNFVIYLIIINLIGFYVMWLDKRKAKKETIINLDDIKNALQLIKKM